MFKFLFFLIPFVVWASDIDQIRSLGEQIEGCPNGCECIIDASRENRARKKLGEYEEEIKGKPEEGREIKIRTK
jgi:hypothetical protein